MFKFVRPIQQVHIKRVLEYNTEFMSEHSQYFPHSSTFYIFEATIIWILTTIINIIAYLYVLNYANIPTMWYDMIK